MDYNQASVAPTVTMKIALIGGSGFIGSRLAGDLQRLGHRVTIIDKNPSRLWPDLFIRADVRDLPALTDAMRGSDVVINLAAEHRDDVRPVSLYHDVNVTGAEHVCTAAETLGIQKIVFTSSAAVYGHQHFEADENTPHDPIGPYGETKSKAEDVYAAWLAKDAVNRSLTMIRPTVIFGPGNRGNVHVLLNQIVKGRFVMIGDGANKKSMAYVENISGFLAHSLLFGPGQHIFNYVDKPDLTTRELIDIIAAKTGRTATGPSLPRFLGLVIGSVFDIAAKITGRNFPISRIRVEKFCATTVFSADRLQSTAFRAPKTLREGLETTISDEFSPAEK